MAPKVTILIPNYNKGKYIAQALESAVNQSYSNFDILIIDNCSTDESVPIIKRYESDKVKVVLHEENKGLVYSLNEGVELSDSDFIMNLSSDDIIATTAVENLMSTLLSESGISIAYSEFLTSQGGHSPSREWDLDRLMKQNYISFSNIYRRKECLSVGGFDPRIPSAEDWDMWIAICQNGGKGKLCKSPEFWYRLDTKGSGLSKLMDNSMGMEGSGFYKVCQYLQKKYEPYYVKSGLTLEQMYYCQFPRTAQDYL